MFKQIKNSPKYLLSLSMIAFLGACGDSENEGANNVVVPGASQLVNATVIDDINSSTMLLYVKGGIDSTATNAFGYKAVKITYLTKGENNEDVNASGLLVIPTVSDGYKIYLDSLGKTFSVSMLCDNHGTIFTDAEAPSNVEVVDGKPNYDLATLMTGYAGFAAIYPDYIGYGESNSIAHPYMMKKSSARASLDMIKASMKYMSDEGVSLNYQLYVSGYSQGGYTAMALAEEIESSFSDKVTFKGVAPMAGPHDLEALANIEINASHTMVYPAFLGYLADSYAYYNDDVNLSDIAVLADTDTFHTLFNGSYINVAIHVGLGLANGTTDLGFLTHKANELFKDSFINDYQNNINSVMREKFIENRSYSSWTPKTKVNLVHCVDDEIIPFSMSQNAFIDLNATGADVTLSPIPSAYIPAATATNPFVHGRCGSVAYGVAVKWFAGIRSGEIK